ncbi:MAG: hypothetical protein Fues2KO_47290 [Fuerstiella sp.]
MPLMVLSFKIEDEVTPGLSKRNLAAANRTTHRFAGEYWLERIMPRHFHGSTQGRYELEPRNEIYLRIIKPKTGQGAGRYALLQKSGASFRFAQFFSRVTATQHRAVVKINVPAYFATPKTGTIYEGGRRKEITRQPNKARELTDTTREDARDVDERATEIYAAHFDPNNRTPGVRSSNERRTILIN